MTAGIVGHVASTQELLNVPDAYNEKLFNRAVDQATGFKTQSILCMPLIKHGREDVADDAGSTLVLGVVQAINKHAKAATPAEDAKLKPPAIIAFNEADESFMRSMCDQLSAAVDSLFQLQLLKKPVELFSQILREEATLAKSSGEERRASLDSCITLQGFEAYVRRTRDPALLLLIAASHEASKGSPRGEERGRRYSKSM